MLYFSQECGVVRQELSTRHKEDTAAALSELAALKDEAMRQAKETWGAKERLLMSQVCWCVKSWPPVLCKHLYYQRLALYLGSFPLWVGFGYKATSKIFTALNCVF